MVWSSSRRKERFNRDWPRVRRVIGERDGWRCQWPVADLYTGVTHKCLRAGNQVDHKRRDGVADDDSPSNLWVLCDYHHALKTETESVEARRLKRDRRKEREWYGHPAFR